MWNLLTIDPSTKNLGWAVFQVFDDRQQVFYDSSGVIKLGPTSDKQTLANKTTADEGPPDEDEKLWIGRSDDMTTRMVKIAHRIQPRLVLVELPRVMASNEAAMRSDAITKLAFCVGDIRGALKYQGHSVRCVPVNKWKGQTSKEVTRHRVTKHWNLTPKDHNEADALGIGDWYVRHVLNYEPVPYELPQPNANARPQLRNGGPRRTNDPDVMSLRTRAIRPDEPHVPGEFVSFLPPGNNGGARSPR